MGLLSRIEIGDWKRYSKLYTKDTDQWYLIPKAKGIEETQLINIQIFLQLLDKWFVNTANLQKKDVEFIKKFFSSSQHRLFDKGDLFLSWGQQAQLFMTCIIFQKGLISRDQESEKLKNQFNTIINDFKMNKSYEEIIDKHGNKLIHNTFCANSRNLINLCQRLGFAWIEIDSEIIITTVGRRFMIEEKDFRPILEQQLRKYQFYNSSITRARYKHFEILPYQFLLRLLILLKTKSLTRDEFAIFVTKAVKMDEMEKCYEWISAYRKLSNLNKQKFIASLKKKIENQRRPKLIELRETASKNIAFITYAGPWERRLLNGAYGVFLTDPAKAKKILEEDAEREFLEVKTKVAWFAQYGNIDKSLDREDIVEYYLNSGRSLDAKKLLKKVKDKKTRKKLEDKLITTIKEEEIQDWYLERLHLIEDGLSLWKKRTTTGRQLETPDGGIIDILTVAQGGELVVLEFKRAKAHSDEIVGQVLRYMGWARKNLSPKKVVRGYLIAYEFDKKIDYALIGMQHPRLPNSEGKDLIIKFKHHFDIFAQGKTELNV